MDGDYYFDSLDTNYSLMLGPSHKLCNITSYNVDYKVSICSVVILYTVKPKALIFASVF